MGRKVGLGECWSGGNVREYKRRRVGREEIAEERRGTSTGVQFKEGVHCLFHLVEDGSSLFSFCPKDRPKNPGTRCWKYQINQQKPGCLNYQIQEKRGSTMY